MIIKHTLNEAYNKIVKPLDRCNEDLNTVPGILKYMQILEKVKFTFDQQMKSIEAELTQEYPDRAHEIKEHIAFLKDNLNSGKIMLYFLFYSFMDCLNFPLSAA